MLIELLYITHGLPEELTFICPFQIYARHIMTKEYQHLLRFGKPLLPVCCRLKYSTTNCHLS